MKKDESPIWHESRQSTLGRDISRTQWLHLAEAAKKVIGDAVMPRNLYNAIHEGFKIGVRL